MNARIVLARAWFPDFIRKRKLVELVRAAADAFAVDMPDFRRKDCDGILEDFALLAGSWAGTAVREHKADEVAGRLFRNGRLLGGRARSFFRPRNLFEVMKAARILYAAIGIDFRGDADGRIVVRRCGFSRHFTPEACRLMGSMDSGILTGLAGEGGLEFSARLTEGAETCRASFSAGRKEP
jgi:hypothetical protein